MYYVAPVTHSVRKDGLYDLKVENQTVFQARKEKTGFRLLNANGEAPQTVPTMAELKTTIGSMFLPPERDLNRPYYTVKQAMMTVDLSHTAMRLALEHCRFNNIPRHQMGFAIVQERMKILAKHYPNLPYPRKWMERWKDHLLPFVYPDEDEEFS